MLVQQAIQQRMSDLSWAQAMHQCATSLSAAPSKVRFTAAINNRDGALTITSWSGHVLDGPDVPADVLDCVARGLPTGGLELSAAWPGNAASLEYDLELELAR